MTFTPSTTNPNAPFGLRAVKYDEKLVIHCSISNSDSAIYLNEPVVFAGGSNATAIGPTPAGTLPVVTGAATTGSILGSILSIAPNNTLSQSQVYNPASTAAEVLVCVDPNAIYEIMTAGGTLTAANIGKNANLLTPTAGTTVTGVSTAAINLATADVTNTLQLRIQSVKSEVDNVLGANAIVLCKINNSNYAPNTAGI